LNNLFIVSLLLEKENLAHLIERLERFEQAQRFETLQKYLHEYHKVAHTSMRFDLDGA
jgi:hypothetical protein